MELLSDKQKMKIAADYPLYSQDSKGKKAVCVAKFFIANWTWYILEGNFVEGKFMMFGIVLNHMDDEYGYLPIEDLESVDLKCKTPFGILPLKVERDLYFKPTTLEKINDSYPKYVLTLDEFPMGEDGIEQKNIIDFLLEEN